MSSFYGNGGYSSGGGGGSGEVISVNGKKGRVILDAADVHALPDSTQIPSLEGFATEAWVNNQDFLISEDISSKADKTEIISKPATAGTEGQVLTIDANGNPKWDDTSDMSNYYTKSETYNKTEVDSLIDNIDKSMEDALVLKANSTDVTALEMRVTAVEDDIYKPYATDTASGAIASFADGADNTPLKSLVVNIDPVQDLHGQDAPYPAGGGKNLIDSRLSVVQAINTEGMWNNNVYTLNGLTFTVADDGHITINGTATANTFFTVYRNSEGITLPAGSYVLHKSGSADIIVAAPKDGAYWTSATTNDSVVTLTESARISYYVQIQSGKTISNYNLYPMLEAGTVATLWTPYENICPISGWTGMTVSRTGKNLFTYVPNKIYVPLSVTLDKSRAILVKKGITYSMSFDMQNATTWRICAVLFDLEGNRHFVNGEYPFGMVNPCLGPNASGQYYVWGGNYTNKSFVITPIDDFYAMFFFSLGDTTESTVMVNSMLEIGSTATPYEPYAGQTIPISWQTEAGTVYGGKLDVLSGELVIDRAKHIFGQSDVIKGLASGTNGLRLRIDIDDARIPTSTQRLDFMCNAGTPSYDALTTAICEVGDCMLYDYGGVTTFFYIVPLDCNTVQKAMDYITGLGLEIVYPLATPIEIQLTPHEVRSLLGQNNIFADTGDTEVEYRADTKMYIERLTEPDADMIADSNIVSGQYFLVGNSLYLATANIASGGQVIVGTNATRKSLATALNEINS